MSQQLDDEVLSINSIYESETLKESDDSSRYILMLPDLPDVKLQIDFPPDYPDGPPSIPGTQSTGSSIAKGEGQQIVEILRATLAEVYQVGAPCIYDLVEEATSKLQQLGWTKSSVEERSKTLEKGQEPHAHDQDSSDQEEQQQSHELGSAPAPAWTLSEVVTEKKSVFVARAASVQSVEQAKESLRHLLVTDKKIARATHNITAWRIRGTNGTQYQDCDDDGETAAGGRLLHLLELMDVWDVMVVVTRWYGGVHLGSDRFRIINQVARDALVKGPWYQDTAQSKKKPRR